MLIRRAGGRRVEQPGLPFTGDLPPVLDLRANPKARFEADNWSFGHRPKGAKRNTARTFIVLAPDRTLLYRWGAGNTLHWTQARNTTFASDFERNNEGVIDIAHRMQNTPGGTGATEIVVTADGRVVIEASNDQTRWPGVKTKYTPRVHKLVAELLRRGLIRPNHRVFSGNWASLEGDFLGTARVVAKRPAMPRTITLFHGTSTHRWDRIKHVGLRPVEPEMRAWKGERHSAPHRDEAVYLTASRGQARYYGTKAVTVARRHGVSGSKPMVLRVTLRAREFSKLRADDDWLNRRRFSEPPLPVDPLDWYGSLTEFAQVALVGTVPPHRLTVVEPA